MKEAYCLKGLAKDKLFSWHCVCFFLSLSIISIQLIKDQLLLRLVTHFSGLSCKAILWHSPIQLGSAALMANAIMANQIPRNLLQWEGGYWNSTPVWPQEPDVVVLKSLARRVLLSRLPAPVDHNLLEITFFAAGAFNKLYLITYPRHKTSYLFRVTLPVCPFLKT